MAIYFYFGLSTRTFEVILIPVVKFVVTCSVSEILEDILDIQKIHDVTTRVKFSS